MSDSIYTFDLTVPTEYKAARRKSDNFWQETARAKQAIADAKGDSREKVLAEMDHRNAVDRMHTYDKAFMAKHGKTHMAHFHREREQKIEDAYRSAY